MYIYLQPGCLMRQSILLHTDGVIGPSMAPLSLQQRKTDNTIASAASLCRWRGSWAKKGGWGTWHSTFRRGHFTQTLFGACLVRRLQHTPPPAHTTQAHSMQARRVNATGCGGGEWRRRDINSRLGEEKRPNQQGLTFHLPKKVTLHTRNWSSTLHPLVDPQNLPKCMHQLCPLCH